MTTPPITRSSSSGKVSAVSFDPLLDDPCLLVFSHAAGARVFVVGVGGVSAKWTRAVASSPSATFSVDVTDFGSLDGVREKVKRSICRASSRRKRGSRASNSLFLEPA